MIALSAKGLSKRFGKRAVLDGLDLDVKAGTVLVLLGENGAGKSTLMKLALGVLSPEAGTLSVAGLDPWKNAAALRRVVGYVPDKPDVYPWMTVPDLFRYLAPLYPRWNDERARSLADALSVPLDVRFKHLSRGQGMKAMLAAALAQDPDVLLLDEPFAGLDPVVREDVLRGVIAELKDGRRTVVCATHELDAAARIADTIAVLAHGKIVRHGTLAEVTNSVDEPADAPAMLQGILAEISAGEGR